jgi:hypothetical protein
MKDILKEKNNPNQVLKNLQNEAAKKYPTFYKKYNHGKTALYISAEHKNMKIIEASVETIQDDNKNIPLHHKGKWEHMKFKKGLTKIGPDIKIQGKNGNTVITQFYNDINQHTFVACKDFNQVSSRNKYNKKPFPEITGSSSIMNYIFNNLNLSDSSDSDLSDSDSKLSGKSTFADESDQ